MPMDEFVALTKDLCGFPSFFNAPLFRRILKTTSEEEEETTDQRLPLETFVEFWKTEIEPFDAVERFFRLLKEPEAETITKADFFPYLKGRCLSISEYTFEYRKFGYSDIGFS